MSQGLAKALPSNATGADGSGIDADLDEVGTDSLSPREWDVLRLLSEGLGSTEIAEALRISEATVRTYIKVVQGKLDLKGHSRPAAYELLDQQAFEI